MTPEMAANVAASHYVEATARPITKDARAWLVRYFREGTNERGEPLTAILEGDRAEALLEGLGEKIKKPKTKLFLIAAAEAYAEQAGDELAGLELAAEVIEASKPILSAPDATTGQRTRLCTGG